MIPVLDIGGTHVTAALVDGSVVVDRRVMALDSSASAREITRTLISCADSLMAPRGAVWAVAMPGPFDYSRGIGLFEPGAKFAALSGVDLRAVLGGNLRAAPGEVRFLNDAHAFGLGEWTPAARRGHKRMLAITLGTGVGSSFIDNGQVVHDGPDVPPEGHVYRLTIDGRPLEDTVSRRAIIERYAGSADVAQIAALARLGAPRAWAALREPCVALGVALAPWVRRFDATIVVFGGAIARSWDVIGPFLTAGLDGAAEIMSATDLEHAVLIGAATHVRHEGSE